MRSPIDPIKVRRKGGGDGFWSKTWNMCASFFCDIAYDSESVQQTTDEKIFEFNARFTACSNNEVPAKDLIFLFGTRFEPDRAGIKQINLFIA